MPYTYNGVGTWYYGQDRMLKVHSKCDLCGYEGELKSYDTSHFFVVLFIPIIPLGKYRIIEECPSCQQHRAVKLSQWEEQKAAAVADLREQIKTDGDKRQAAINAVHLAVAFQDAEMLKSVNGSLASRMTDDAEVQSVLGCACAYFGDTDGSIEAFEHSLKAKEDVDVSEFLAVALLKKQQPEEAEQHLQHLLDPGDPEKSGYIMLLAEGYQVIGNHGRAADLLEQCESLVPELSKDKEFQKLRKKAEKLRGTSRPVKAKLLDSSPAYTESTRGGSIARWLFPILAVIAFLSYLAVAFYKGTNREVVVTNGTQKNYVALINGEEVSVPGLGYVKHRLAEGEVTLSIKDRPEFEAGTVVVETGFWGRPFKSPVIILNPDRIALVNWEKSWYGDNINQLPEAEWELAGGEFLHRWDSVDYPFEAFPQQLQAKKNSKNISKTRVGLLDRSEFNDTMLITVIMGSLSPQQIHDYTKGWATSEPEKDIAVGLWIMQAQPEEFREWAKPRLDQQPVLVELHRGYQTFVERSSPKHDLVQEYRDRLAAHPNDPVLKYLLARVVPDHVEERKLLLEAAQGDAPSAHARHGLAFNYLAMGEFQEAVPYALSAIQQMPNAFSFERTYFDVMTAAGQVDQGLSYLDDRINENKRDYMRMTQKVDLMLSGNNRSRRNAASTIEQMATEFGQESPQFADQLRKSWNAKRLYANGEMQQYADAIRREAGDVLVFEAEFAARDFTQAAQALDAQSDHESDDAASQRLMLYIAFMSQGDEANAKVQLQKGIALLEKGSADERKLATALSDAGVPTPQDLLTISEFPAQKRVYLAALGYRYPQDRRPFWSLAKRLNYHRTVPYHFLQGLKE
ncbi:MAG: hypothetical protein R3C01_02910 [Planctomycetaceae bacterium]